MNAMSQETKEFVDSHVEKMMAKTNVEEYKKWLEVQIEKCLNDKDLQREHWAFCKAYEKLIETIKTKQDENYTIPIQESV